MRIRSWLQQAGLPGQSRGAIPLPVEYSFLEGDNFELARQFITRDLAIGLSLFRESVAVEGFPGGVFACAGISAPLNRHRAQKDKLKLLSA
jgi:hypothetical protein